MLSFDDSSLTDFGVECAITGVPTCFDECVYAFGPVASAPVFLSRNEFQNGDTSVFRVGITLDPGDPLIQLVVSAIDLCPSPD